MHGRKGKECERERGELDVEIGVEEDMGREERRIGRCEEVGK